MTALTPVERHSWDAYVATGASQSFSTPTHTSRHSPVPTHPELLLQHPGVVVQQHGEVQRTDGMLPERLRVLRQPQPVPHPVAHAHAAEHGVQVDI